MGIIETIQTGHSYQFVWLLHTRIKIGENMAMSEAALEARRAYKREWQRKNKDKVKAQQARYWERKAAEGDSGRREAADNGSGD